MKKLLVAGAAVAALLVTATGPAGAISDGTKDGNQHPYVGLMVATDADGAPMWRCSGSMISPRIYVTAGHCTFGAAGALVWFESDLEPDPSEYGYPDNLVPKEFDEDGNPTAFVEGTAISGTPYSHPLYDDAGFFLYDLGVVVLDEPAPGVDSFAALPTPDDYGIVDTYRTGRKNGSTVTVVGYGLQELVEGPIVPDFDPKLQSDKTRYETEVAVISVKGAGGAGSRSNKLPGSGSFITSGDPTTGGTCPGDSGGPNLDGDTNLLVGITSFGFNANCKGPGGAYRIDRAEDVDFIHCVEDHIDDPDDIVAVDGCAAQTYEPDED